MKVRTHQQLSILEITRKKTTGLKLRAEGLCHSPYPPQTGSFSYLRLFNSDIHHTEPNLGDMSGQLLCDIAHTDSPGCPRRTLARRLKAIGKETKWTLRVYCRLFGPWKAERRKSRKGIGMVRRRKPFEGVEVYKEASHGNPHHRYRSR